MTPEEFNDVDWGKFFMAASVALIMIIQAWHGNEISAAHEKADLAHVKADAIHEKIVPRSEYERRHLSKMNVEDAIHIDDAMHRDEILLLIGKLNKKMNNGGNYDTTRD